MNNIGVLCLVPTIILFVLILTTKRVFLSLLCAGLSGAFLAAPGLGFLQTYATALQESIAGNFLPYFYVLMSVFGIYICMVERTGSARSFAKWLSKYAKKRWMSLILTELMGIIVFVDDALNNVAVGTSMCRLTDHYRVPRSFLGYVTISTSAPVCILIPISTWAVFNGGLLLDNGVGVTGDPVATFSGMLPFMFFGFATLLLLTLVNLGVIPMLGSTRRQQKYANETGIVLKSEDALHGEEIHADDAGSGSEERATPWPFLIPLAVLIGATILRDNDVIFGCTMCILVSVVMMLIQKIPFKDICKSCMDGIVYMLPLFVQLTLSTTMVSLNTTLGMPDFVVQTVTPVLSGALMPVTVFLLLTLYSALGGGFWEMSMLFMPVVIPMALKMGVNPYLAGAAVVCASAAGSSLYVCGDTIALVSSVVGTKPTTQATAILPYALISVGLSAIGFLAAGLLS